MAFEGDPPQLRKHEQGIVHTVGLLAMCAPFLMFAMHVERPSPETERPAANDQAAVAAKAVPSRPASSDRVDDSPSYFDQNDASRVVLRRILFVPSDDQAGSEKMDVLYDVDPETNTVQIEESESIRGSVEAD